jgi:DNA-binding HxlR family transcriptional regulator
MDWLATSAENCSIGRTLELVGEKWTLLIIRDAVNGVRRFDDFLRHIGLSAPVLAERLRRLVAAGILQPRPYQEEGKRTRTEYLLTDKGWDLQPALVALMQWGDKHLADPEGPPVKLHHAACGAPLRAAVICERDKEIVGPRQTSARPGPSAKPYVPAQAAGRTRKVDRPAR